MSRENENPKCFAWRRLRLIRPLLLAPQLYLSCTEILAPVSLACFPVIPQRRQLHHLLHDTLGVSAQTGTVRCRFGSRQQAKQRTAPL